MVEIHENVIPVYLKQDLSAVTKYISYLYVRGELKKQEGVRKARVDSSPPRDSRRISAIPTVPVFEYLLEQYQKQAKR